MCGLQASAIVAQVSVAQSLRLALQPTQQCRFPLNMSCHTCAGCRMLMLLLRLSTLASCALWCMPPWASPQAAGSNPPLPQSCHRCWISCKLSAKQQPLTGLLAAIRSQDPCSLLSRQCRSVRNKRRCYYVGKACCNSCFGCCIVIAGCGMARCIGKPQVQLLSCIRMIVRHQHSRTSRISKSSLNIAACDQSCTGRTATADLAINGYSVHTWLATLHHCTVCCKSNRRDLLQND